MTHSARPRTAEPIGAHSEPMHSSGRELGKWDHRFLKLAKDIATDWSKDPSTKTGAVIVRGKNLVVSLGYNGLPPDMEDKPEILNNRELKYRHVIHAEPNAITFAENQSGAIRKRIADLVRTNPWLERVIPNPVALTGCRIYVWPFMPCVDCARRIVKAGIEEVIAPWCDLDHPRWGASFRESLEEFRKNGVSMVFAPSAEHAIGK